MTTVDQDSGNLLTYHLGFLQSANKHIEGTFTYFQRKATDWESIRILGNLVAQARVRANHIKYSESLVSGSFDTELEALNQLIRRGFECIDDTKNQAYPDQGILETTQAILHLILKEYGNVLVNSTAFNRSELLEKMSSDLEIMKKSDLILSEIISRKKQHQNDIAMPVVT